MLVGKHWNHLEWFRVPTSDVLHPAIKEAETIARSKRIGEHPFIQLARTSKEPLVYWVQQELIVTGPFSLFLFKLCAQIKNVHLRALMAEITHGEHGSVIGHVAYRSHPWLLRNLTTSMGIELRDVEPADETIKYLAILEEESESLIRGLGALGMGSEYLLLDEYSAIKGAFDAQHPNCEYEDFLNSNINEDRWHSSLIETVASNLITSDEVADQFLLGATRGIEARIDFYDRAFSRMTQ